MPDPRLDTWTLAAAKTHFSEVVERAKTRPQTVTRYGQVEAVVVSAAEWARKTERHGTLAEFLLASPLRGTTLDLERVRTPPQDPDQ